MKYINEYLKDVTKIKPLGELTTKDDELNGMSGEMVYIDGKCSDIFISHADYANWLEKQSEQKFADKIEPKFHEGEWIVFNGLALYIKEVVKGYYRTISKGGIINRYDWDIDNVARLWTIQDAKNGDVLVDRYNNIGIFLQYLCIHWCSQIYLDCNGKLRGFCLGGSHEPTGTHPATKEQCDILFKKMKEKGFEWDAENKWVKM